LDLEASKLLKLPLNAEEDAALVNILAHSENKKALVRPEGLASLAVLIYAPVCIDYSVRVLPATPPYPGSL
jgi:hypothetical protein